MPKRMADEAFRIDQFERRYEKHVKRINRYADWLTERDTSRVPYVAPHQGGVGARLLSLSSNPGPKTDSGFISCENDDGSAARMAGLYESAGISQTDTVPWNAYPWFIHDELAGKGLDGTQISEGQRPLWKMIEMLRELRVVVLHGVDAQKAWAAIARAHGHDLWKRNVIALPTIHTSNRVLTRDRDAKESELAQVYSIAAQILSSPP